MHFAPLLTLLLAAFATAVSLSYDTVYDQRDNSLSTVSCSNGSNGLQTKGYTTFGSLPTFPNIGGVPAITAWNSPNCGTCWQITYPQTSKTIYLLGIDEGKGAFNVAESAMNTLTNGHAVEFGRIDVVAQQVDASKCRM